MYSCALWSEEEGGVNGDLVSGPTRGDIEAAQMRKIHHVLRQLAHFSDQTVDRAEFLVERGYDMSTHCPCPLESVSRSAR